MVHSLLQRSAKAAVISATALTAAFLSAPPGYSQSTSTFSSGPFRTFSDRPLSDLQSLGSDVICGNDLERSRSIRSRFAVSRRYNSADTLTNNPLIPSRLDAQPANNPLIGPTLTNDPLVPNRLNAQTSSTGPNQTSSPSNQSVNCQTIRDSSITTVNQPLSNQSVNITINNSRVQSAGNAMSSRAVSGKLPLSTIANLPDGNYRVTSAANVSNDIGLAELANRGGRLFSFSKSGDTITGNLSDFDGGFSACVTGSVEGNIVTGQAFTNDLGANVLGRNYLDLGLALELGNRVAGDRYNNSALNLSGFSRINAGAVLPPTRC